jgi:glutathione S-transferase
MPLTLYHLGFSQCDRLIWLCEELKLANPDFTYELRTFPRGLPSSEGKKTLFALHPSGTSPTIVDDTVSPPVQMTESQACLEYILARYGNGLFELTLSKDGPQQYADYLYWLSFANGSFQSWLTLNLTISSLCAQKGIDIEEERKTNFLIESNLQRTPNHLAQYEAQLSKPGHKCLLGPELTACDFMNIYGLTFMRGFYDLDLSPYPNLLRYLKDVTDRPAYRSMLENAEDGIPPMIHGRVKQFPFEVILAIKGWRSMFTEEELKAGNVTMERKEGDGGREEGHVGKVDEEVLKNMLKGAQ